MKKILALALSVLMIFTCLVGCGDKANGDLASAVAYLENMYQTGEKGEPIKIESDKEVLSVVTIDGVSYNVEWAIAVTEGASDAVAIAEAKTENCVKIDVPEMSESDILFTATATVKDEKGNTATAEFSYKVFGIEIATGDDAGAIVDAAYELAAGAKMDGEQTLTGKITKIDTKFSTQYNNITVTIVVDGKEDKPIKCFRLAGEGADALAVGDTITVTGTIVNYEHTSGDTEVEFDAGCVLKSVTKGDGAATDAPASNSVVTDEAKILADAFALENGKALSYVALLKGTVTSVDAAWTEDFGGQISVTIKVGDKSVYCFKMKTDNSSVGVTDEISVKGVIKNYNGTVEFAWDEASQTEVVMVDYKKGPGLAATALSMVDTPVAGTAYKFGMHQTLLDKVLYATGDMKGYYMATTEDSGSAVDVYLEETSGGYYLYAMIGGAKKYMNMEVSGTHVNAVYRDTATSVYTYDTAKKTLVTKVEKEGEQLEYAFGTYDSYTTIGTSKTSYEDNYFCHFYK